MEAMWLSRNVWQPESPIDQLDVVIAGDTAFGENYQEKRAAQGQSNILTSHGYDHGFTLVDPLLREADLVIANLETPLTSRRSSPFEGQRPWLHYSDPTLAPRHLAAHNILAVMLANDHVFDFAEAGLTDTLKALDTRGITAIGAGANSNEAHAPLRVRATVGDGHESRDVRFSIFNAFNGGRRFRDELNVYADKNKPGLAGLQLGKLERQIARIKEANPSEFVIISPHWRGDYQWRSVKQAEAAVRLMDAGADLIVGTGSHMMQEVERFGGRWVFNGIGNFVLNSPGAYARKEVPPYSFVIRITATPHRTFLRAYPILSDNRRSDYQPTPVTVDQFEEIRQTLKARTNAPDAFSQELIPEHDNHGWHFKLELHPASDGDTTSPAEPAVVGAPERAGVPAEAPVLSQVDPAHLNSEILAFEARRRGMPVHWLAKNFFITQAGGAGLAYWITNTHRTGVAATMAAARKDVGRLLLADAGLPVADGRGFEPTLEEAARDYAMSLGDAVVKPVDGRKGRGITVGVHTPEEFQRAWRLASAEEPTAVLVERRFPGTDARFLVVGDRCVSVIKRVPPSVVGNGRDTVQQLIDNKNRSRARNPHASKYVIAVNPHRVDYIRQQGFDIDDVPPDGVVVELDLKASLSDGADSVDITDDVHPTFRTAAIQATLAFPGLDVAGVDIMAGDFASSADDANCVIIEMNSCPAIGAQHFPMVGQRRDVAAAVFDLHLKGDDAEKASHRPGPGAATLGAERWAGPDADAKPRAIDVEPGTYFDPSTHLIALELIRRGIGLTWINPSFFVADVDGARMGYWSTASHATGRAGVRAANRRDLSRAALATSDLPVAEGGVFRRHTGQAEAAELVNSLGASVVATTEVQGDHARVVPISSPAEFDEAWRTVAEATERVVVIYQQSAGATAEFLVVGSECLAAHADDGADLTERVDPGFRRVAEAAVAALPGLDVAKVIIESEDFTLPPAETTYVVGDVLGMPDISPYHFPVSGPARDVAGAIVDLHLSRLGDEGSMKPPNSLNGL
ncbi:CapA family protein [Phytoactinopolyspora mesophila]|uniref:ATP-grasp domain-containing protein n=1 Tax=Phytoactinopolyspora mesophila TaxID=2650750 RepID=A0A7K3MAP5_9ACTN|nr:CapA family protein [Phytoactinopolyspora mesophila]NDL60250.1 hypothetical protein [Phytoactinopolyspora mesophila]